MLPAMAVVARSLSTRAMVGNIFQPGRAQAESG